MSTLDEINEDWQVNGLSPTWAKLQQAKQEQTALIAERDALKAENERLTNCLKKANDQAEDFERRWYLADMELERIKALPPVAWCLGNPEFADSSNVFLAHEFTPDGEHEDEWTALYALGSKT